MDKPLASFGKVVMPQKKAKRKMTKLKAPQIVAELDLKLIFKNVLACVFGWLCGTFVIFGNFNPVGIACIAAFFGSSERFYIVLLSVFLGYVTRGIYGVAMYIVAVCACAVANFFFFSKERSKFIQALGGGICLFVGAAVFSLVNGGSVFIIARGAAEALCAVALCLILKMGLDILSSGITKHILGAEELLCAGTVIIIVIGTIAVKGSWGFGIAMVLATAFLLAISFKAGTQVVALGAVFGLCLLFLQCGTKELFLMLCTATLLSGTFCQKKIYTIIGFFVGFIIPAFYLGAMPESGIIISVALGCGIFAAMPDSVLNKINTFQNHKEEFEHQDYFVRLKELTEIRLKNFAGAFGALAKVFDTEEVPKEVTPKAAAEIVDKVAEKVCESCSMSLYCWRTKSYETYEGILRLVGAVEKNGMAQAKDLTKWLENSCVRVRDMVDASNICGREYKNDLVWRGRLNESRGVLKEQLMCVEEIIADLSTHAMPQPIFYESAAKEIKERLIKKGLNIQRVYVAAAGREGITVSVTKDACFGNNQCKSIILPAINSVIGRRFGIIKKGCETEDQQCTVIFKELNGYSLKTAVAAVAKHGSEQSGDTYHAEETADKKGIMVVCDGMGTGESAAKESRRAADLIKDFLRAGFPLGLTVKVLNSALATGNKEIYTTMDICSVDLYSGKVDIIKNGGATVFVATDMGVEAIRSESLPMGILKDWHGDVAHAQVKHGDMVVMVTDGVTEALGIDSEVAVVSRAVEESEGNSQKLASGILKYALRETGGQAKDDMTVLVGRIY